MKGTEQLNKLNKIYFKGGSELFTYVLVKLVSHGSSAQI